jgi:hypothetical protein
MYRQLYQMGGIGTLPMDYGQSLQVPPQQQPSFSSAQNITMNPLLNYGQPQLSTAGGTPLTMANGGSANLVEREKYGLGSKLKKFVRNIIPNEIAEIAVKAAPFVAPFNPLLAAGMAGIGGFDQTGRIGSSLKSAALTYGAGQIARGIGGAGFQEGFNPFAGFDSSASFGGLGSLFSSPMGTQPFGTFSNATTPTPITSITPTQSNFIGTDALTYDPTTGQQLGRSAQELQSTLVSGGGLGPNETGRSASELIKTYGTQPGTEPGYIDLIKKAGSLENVPLSERFNAVKDLSSKALTDLFTKPIPGQPGKTQLDKTALYATFAGASSYIEARKLADKAGVPESEFNEADYQRLNIDPEKSKLSSTLKPGSFGIREAAAAEGGRIGYGIGDLVRSSGIAQPVSGGDTSGGGFGMGLMSKLIQQNPQMFKTQMTSSRRDFIDTNENGIDDREEAAGGGLMNEGVLSIKLTPAQAMAKGGSMGSEIPVRQNQGGISELDLRAKGGYIPVGIKEKADDVPAMLSRNEFVFTADAVRGAGNGSINKGAQKMYKLMKSLEKKVKQMKKVA